MAILKCSGLTKSFGRVTALEAVDLEVESGRIVGLLGPNGSGKTTLIKLANGLLAPGSGEILVGGKKPGTETKKLISFLPERQCLPDWMSARDLMGFYADFYDDFDRAAAEEMLKRLELDTGKKLKHLSKGSREKVQLIMVMARRAKLYLLDEPIGGVDPAARDYILETIISNYNPEASVIISTHLIADVERVLDDVVFLNKGRVALASSADDLRERHGKSVDMVFREVFKC